MHAWMCLRMHSFSSWWFHSCCCRNPCLCVIIMSLAARCASSVLTGYDMYIIWIMSSEGHKHCKLPMAKFWGSIYSEYICSVKRINIRTYIRTCSYSGNLFTDVETSKCFPTNTNIIESPNSAKNYTCHIYSKLHACMDWQPILIYKARYYNHHCRYNFKHQQSDLINSKLYINAHMARQKNMPLWTVIGR